MSRYSALAKLPAIVLAVSLAIGCERSATAPATAPAPSLSFGPTGDGGQLQAPAHRGGSKTDTFGRSGGRLHFDDTSAPGIEYWLDVPAGAVRTPTTFVLQVLPGDHYLVSLKATASGKDVGKDGFAQPVRLTISYSSARHPAPPPHLFVAWVPDDGGAPVPVKTQVNPGQKTVTGYLPHFSRWTIIAD